MVTRPDKQIGMEDIFDETVDEVTPKGQYPKTISSQFFPKEPNILPLDAASYLLPFLRDPEDPQYSTPSLTDEQIDAMYAPTDMSGQKKLALAQFGFGLMRPTEGGRIGAVLADSGAQLAGDLSKIKMAQANETKQNNAAKITAKLQRDAQDILEKKAIDESNRGILMNIANMNYDAVLSQNNQQMKLYNEVMKAAQGKFMDYQLDGIKPKQVQVAYTDETGDVGTPFDAFVVQSITEDGTGLTPPQYYRPTNKMGADGYPIMELIENPEGIVEVPLSITGSPNDFKSAKGMTTFRDLLTGLQTTDRALLTLDELETSFLERPGRAGFIAGIKGRFQTYAQIFSDLYNEQFNGFFSEDDLVQFNNTYGDTYETGQFKGQKMEKFQNLASTINLYLQDPQTQADIASGKISAEEVAALQSANNVFDQLAATGLAQMRVEAATSGVNAFGEQRFEGTQGRSADQEKELIFKKLRLFDSDLPANQVRANSIIYAIARARKSSGRLNLDDIERAAKDLNIYGDSSADVISKIGVLRTQLERSREDALANIQIMYGTGKDNYFDKLIELGYGSYNRDRTYDYATDPKAKGYVKPGAQTSGAITGGFDYSIGVN
jgi:hypothetical protein